MQSPVQLVYLDIISSISVAMTLAQLAVSKIPQVAWPVIHLAELVKSQ